MNREILFRGKRLDNGEWVYGDIYRDWDGRPCGICDCCGHNPAIPETIGQYTGLKDRNGVAIFEGDIMMFYTGTKGVVTYSKQGFVWQGYPQDQHNPMGWFGGKWRDDFEKIGNIHDNPELLEVE